MKLKELLEDINEEIESDKVKKAKKIVKEKMIEINEIKKALEKAELNLEKLLRLDIDEIENDVW